jgi:uncharacterized membrane protein YjjP (DUF1212 family)
MKAPLDPQEASHRALSHTQSLPSSNPEPKQPIGDDEFETACQFVTQMVSQAHEYGASYIRLNDFMRQLPQMFGFHGAMLVASPLLVFEFWRDKDGQPHRVTVRVPTGSSDLAKLSQLGILVNDLIAGTLSIDEGMARLEQIDAESPPYPHVIVALGYALSGAGFAVLLSASWRDVFFAALLSLVVYAVTMIANRSQWLANRLNFVAAFAASVLANLLAILFPGSNAFTVSLCAVIVLIPGLGLTIGAAELASSIIYPGIARLVDAILVTFALVVGNTLGSLLVNALWTVPSPDPDIDRSLWITFLSVIILMCALVFVFQARLVDMGWVILAGVVAYIGMLIGDQLGTWQGSFLGALLLGLYTSLFNSRLHRPGSVVMLPAIMILVPGVAAYFGLNTLQTSGIIGALPAVWGVFVQIVAILGGLFVAASILPQKTSL